MKNHSQTLLAAGALALALAVPMSAGGDKHGHPDEFKAMDTNGDGNVTRAEHQAFTRSLHEKGDADRDGGITAAEWDAVAGKSVAVEKMDAAATAAQLKAMDTNADGKVSLAESESFATSVFTKADTDNDGQLTKSEYKAANKAAKAKR